MDLSFGRARQWARIASGIRSSDPAPASAQIIAASARAFSDDVITHGPNAHRVERAFAEYPPNRLEVKGLRALLDNPGATGLELSDICGWVPPGWRTHMLVACHRRQQVLWPEGLPDDLPPGFALTALVTYEPSSLRFWMREELTPVLAAHV